MNWFRRLIKGGQMERELDSELRFHFESQVASKIQAGMNETAARRATRLEFGGIDQVKENCRESRGTLWLASIAQDLRFGARILVRSPGFSATAILVLALGIGVSTIAFSLYNLIALQSIPVHDPETLVSTQRRSPENIAPGVPWASIVYYRDHAKTLSAVMATRMGAPMEMEQDEQRILPGFFSANYFAELGATTANGRLFDASREDSVSAAPVAVLSYRLWQRRFAGDASVVGRTIHLAGKPLTVIGVTSESFANLGTMNPDIYLPLEQYSYFVAGSKPIAEQKYDGQVGMWARLAPGATISKAQQELLELTNQLRKLYPAEIWDGEYIRLSPGAHFFSFDEGPPVLALVALLVLLILAVACANLGGLLMARGVKRRPEIQLRVDLGAKKSRIVRQLITESLLLGFLGAVAALPLSYCVLRFTLLYANGPAWMSAMPDWRVLQFSATMGLVASLFFGLAPALQSVRGKKERTWWHQLVVCAQVGASCVLLILAGLLVRATLHTLYTNPGFAYEQVFSMNPALGAHGYTPTEAEAYLDKLQGRLRGVPGVTSVSLAMSPPLVNEMVMITSIDVEGKRVLIYPNWVGAEFFETMGIPLLNGRYLRAGEKHAVVISESLARRRWPNENPVGKQWDKDGKDTVVGVVGNTRAMEMNNTDATEIYYPPATDNMPQMNVLVKISGSSEHVAPRMKGIASAIDPRLYPTITSLKSGFRKSVAQAEQIATIISLLGGVAIFLATVGLLGLVSFAVSQRMKELAIRLALGANRSEIATSVLRRFARPVLIGLVLGVGVTAALSQVLRRVLYGISGLDPVSYLGAICVLIAVLAMAALVPLRRAFRLDIARILHSE